MAQDVDPGFDVGFVADGDGFAAVVDGPVEEALEGDGEGEGAGAGHAGADDLDLFCGVRGAGGALAHILIATRGWDKGMVVSDGLTMMGIANEC